MTTQMLVTIATLDSKPIIKRETEKAILIEICDEITTWMPKSQIEGFLSTVSGVWMVATPFIVKEKGLSYRAKATTEGDIFNALNDGTATWV
mgnify:CR=1 FL=1